MYAVGDRVMVVDARDAYAQYNGKCGTIVEEDDRLAQYYRWRVALDNGPASEWFATAELTNVDVTVIEGVVRFNYNGMFIAIGEASMMHLLTDGENYHITVEKLPREA